MVRRGPRPRFGLSQIQEIAKAIILEVGLDGLTMNLLAKRLGTSPSSLYRYYPSKEAILVALQVEAIGEIEDELLSRLAAFDREQSASPDVRTDALKRCLLAFDVYARGGEEGATREGLIDAFLSQPKPFLSVIQAQEVNRRLSRVLALCVRVLDKAVDAGALEAGDNEQRSHLLWASLHGLGQFKKRDRIQPEKLRAQALKRALYRSVFQGFGASKGDLQKVLE
jgi:AcrR family transcriptional regulator